MTSRRRDLLGALAETVLDRRLTPLEHTAIDLALAETVRTSEVPILPTVVDHLLTPTNTADADEPTGREVSGLVAAFASGVGLFFLRNLAQVLGDNGQVPPLLAGWTPPLVGGLLAVALILAREDG